MYAPGAKRQKVAREVTTRSTSTEQATNENFQGIGRIEYKPESPFLSEDNLYYRYYNATERIHGRAMEDWLKPSIFLGKAFTPYPGCIPRPWSDNSQNIDNYKKSIRAMFELCIKLGIKYWSGYDKDIAPEGETFEETQSNYEQMIELLNEYQQKTGIKPLWIGADFKNNNKYKNGAVTNSDANITTYAGFQIKRALDIANKLNSECFLFTGEQEGYESIINTDINKELKHYVRFLKMIVDQRDRIGYRGQLLIDTNYVSTKNAYNSDLGSTLTLLKHYNYDRYFKVKVKMGHDFYMANAYSSLGCVDIKNKDLLDVPKSTLMLRTIIENGGLTSGGLTFFVPNFDGVFEAKDLAVAFITSLDSHAKALRLAVKLVNDVQINKNIQLRYLSFSTGWASKLNSDSNLEECEEQVKKLQETNYNIQGNATRTDHWTAVLSRYADAPLK